MKKLFSLITMWLVLGLLFLLSCSYAIGDGFFDESAAVTRDTETGETCEACDFYKIKELTLPYLGEYESGTGEQVAYLDGKSPGHTNHYLITELIMECFKKTNDLRFLNMFITHFNEKSKYLNHRLPGTEDAYRGNRILKTWGAPDTRQGIDTWTNYVLNSAITTIPALKFIEYMEKEGVNDTDEFYVEHWDYQYFADTFWNTVKDAIESHNEDWRSDGVIGYYIWPPDFINGGQGKPLPNNMLAAAGSALLRMGRVCELKNENCTDVENSYKDKAIKIARYLRGQLKLHADNKENLGYSWNYVHPYGNPGGPVDSRLEDSGHMPYLINFVHEAYLSEVEFTKGDLIALRNSIDTILTYQLHWKGSSEVPHIYDFYINKKDEEGVDPCDNEDACDNIEMYKKSCIVPDNPDDMYKNICQQYITNHGTYSLNGQTYNFPMFNLSIGKVGYCGIYSPILKTLDEEDSLGLQSKCSTVLEEESAGTDYDRDRKFAVPLAKARLMK